MNLFILWNLYPKYLPVLPAFGLTGLYWYLLLIIGREQNIFLKPVLFLYENSPHFAFFLHFLLGIISLGFFLYSFWRIYTLTPPAFQFLIVLMFLLAGYRLVTFLTTPWPVDSNKALFLGGYFAFYLNTLVVLLAVLSMESFRCLSNATGIYFYLYLLVGLVGVFCTFLFPFFPLRFWSSSLIYPQKRSHAGSALP